MGRYLSPGHVYLDGSLVTGPNLTEHVEEASFETTSITEQELKDPAELTDQILAVADDAFVQLTLQQIHDLILYPGSVVQTKYGEYTANTNITAVIPTDDTIPQNTEGTEIISLSITPRFATSTILLRFAGQFSTSGVQSGFCALFRGSTSNAIASQFVYSQAGTYQTWNLAYMDSPATTSATTYSLRVGPGGAATLRLNGTNVQRYMGGSSRAVLTAQEIKV